MNRLGLKGEPAPQPQHTLLSSPKNSSHCRTQTYVQPYATYIASVLISALPALGSGLDEDEEYSAGSFTTLLLGALLSDFLHYLWNDDNHSYVCVSLL